MIDASTGIVGEVKVIANGAKIYGARQNAEGVMEAVYLDKSADKDTGLELLELDRPAPKDFVWVTARESLTYYRFRELVGWHLERAVEIPAYHPTKNVNNPDSGKDVDPSRYMNEEQLEAWQGVEARREGYIYQPYPSDKANVYRGKVAIYEQGGIVGANVLMRRKDIGPK